MKKKLLCILLACLFLVLAAVGVLWSENSAEQETPVAEETAVKLYWNIDRNEFVGDSSAGMNTRQREEDGFYSVRFAVDGEQVTYKVEKARLIEEIDSMDIMGLEIDDNGVITAVYNPEDITGGEVASMYYVVISSDTTLTVSADEALEEDYKMFDVNENTGIYNVTGMDPVGFVDTPITSDRIRAFKNEEGEITHVFIVERYGYWPGETVAKYCEHCEQEVQWRVWEEKYTLPTDSAHWILDNKVQVSAQHKLEANKEIILDLNGKTVTGPDSKRVYAMTGENAFLAILDSSEEGTGKIVGGGSPDNGGVIYVRYGTFELYGGTIDASEIATVQYASAVRVNTDCVFNMYGGKIIGGKVVAPENQEDKVTNAGYGGTLYVTGTLNMYDGVITGGSCIESGGNIFVGKAGTLNLYGGKITDGYASKKGGNLAGTGKVNIYKATVSGGSAKTYGGNIFAGNGGVVTLSDDAALVSGGIAKQGGNIYIEKGAAVNVTAGTLKFGRSTAHGGSIAVYGECTVGAGKVLNGNAAEQGGNIFVGKTGVLTVNGAYVQDGTAGTKGGNIAGTGKVNLRAGYVNGGSAKDYGGNIFSGKGANVVVSDDWAIISEGTAKQGGNYYIENGAEVSMTAGLMEAGKSTAHGGSVAVYGVFNFSGGTISGSTATEQGGNIFVGKAGSLTISGGSVLNGTAGTKGGNIAGTGAINIAGGKISDGAAETGGNLFVSGAVDMSGGSIEGGTAENGGGVTVNGATCSMTGGVIKGGEATQDGGCVYIARNVDSDGNTLSLGSFTMQGGEISGGTSKRYGGNVFAGKECTFTLTDGTVLNGSAATRGGNIGGTGKVVMEGGLVSGGESKNGGNIAVAGSGAFDMRGGTVKDGTVTNSTKYDRNVFIIEQSTFTMSGGTIAGGVRIRETNGAVLTGTANITNDQGFENMTLNGNTTVSLGDLTQGAKIGIHPEAIYFATDAVESDKQYFVPDADGVVVYKDGMLGLYQNWTSQSDSGKLPTKSGYYVLSGNMTVSAASTTAKNAEIYFDLNGYTVTGSNNARIYVVDAGTTLTIADTAGTGKIVCNRENTGDAGAIYIKGAGGVFNLEGGTIDASNVTVKNGAAVYVAAGTTFNMSGGTVTGGTATSNGGNVYVAAGAGTFNLSGGTIENGKAATAGNVCALGVFNMTDGTISGGTASGNQTGGNVYATPGNNGGSFTVTGGTIAGLVRVNSTGSVVLGGTAKITGGETNLTLSDKPARLQTTGFSTGAEICVNLEYDAYASNEKHFGVIGTAGDEQYIKLDGEGEIVLTDGKLYLKEEEKEEDNTEPDDGVTNWESNSSLPTEAGSYRLTQNVILEETANVASAVTLDLNGCTVNANGKQAYNISAGGILTITDTVGTGVISGGSTTGNGGTVYVSAGGQFNLYGGTITGGQATNGTGGNVYVEAGTTPGTLNMYGGTITGGKAKQGGNVYVAAGSSSKAAAVFNLYGGTISSGTGTTTAGNVAALGAMTMTGGEITGGIGPASGNHMYAANVYTLPGKNKCIFTMTGGTINGGVRVNNAGAITLGGTARITGGNYNLTFSVGTMTTTGFSAGAEISINSTAYGAEKSFGTGKAGDEAFIKGDNGSTAAIAEDGKLYLVDPTASASLDADQKSTT